MKLFNTLTRKLEEFKPIKPPLVKIYTCGPTVYDYTHIGHLRTYVFADILRRVLEYNGLKVFHVLNITDVGHLTSDADTGEDKLEKGAKKEKKTVWQIADFYTKHFLSSCKKLNIQKPEIICKATEHIKEMIVLVKRLEEKGFTYIILGDGVYFDTSKFPDYGKLTGLSWQQLQNKLKAGARIEKVAGKKHPTDFALWKFAKKGEKRQMEWDSPWGKHSFPGWHIECSAMGMKYLGERFDIHTGGVDHIATHHTNEIAQNEAATGHKVVNFWLHAEHLLVEGQKMAKSLKNFYKIEDLEKRGFDPLSLRYLFLTAHYRSKLNFTWQSLESAQNALFRLREFFGEFQLRAKRKRATALNEGEMKKIDDFKSKFSSAVNNDLDMPKALAVLWEMVKSSLPADKKLKLLLKWDKILGFDLEKSKVAPSPKLWSVGDKSQKSKVNKEIKLLIEKREQLRAQKKWQEADKIRRELAKKGIILEDTPEGTKVKYSKI